MGEIRGNGTAHRNHQMAYLINKKSQNSEVFFLHASDLIMT